MSAAPLGPVPRWVIVGCAILVWSLASGGSGLAWTYGLLLVTRILVGVGEAAYGPVAPTALVPWIWLLS